MTRRPAPRKKRRDGTPDITVLADRQAAEAAVAGKASPRKRATRKREDTK